MNIIKKIRKSNFTRGMAALIILNMLGEIIAPTVSMALTSGPSQPEVQSFEPVETTDMVNLFTGDFTYNIPLMYLPGPNGGYPINLAYHGGVTMDQEASWTGLGWNINAGAIDRNVRGLPDDFNGDFVTTTVDIKDNYTIGLGVTHSIELFGANPSATDEPLSVGALNLSLAFQYNNYKGFGYSFDGNLSPAKNYPTYNIGLSISNEDGVGVNASISLEQTFKKKHTEYELGASFNSKRGLGFSLDITNVKKRYFMENHNGLGETGRLYNQKTGIVGSASFSFSESSHATNISMPMSSNYLSVGLKFGGEATGFFAGLTYRGFYSNSKLKNAGIPRYNPAYGYENLHGYENNIVGTLDNSIPTPIGDFSRINDGNIMKTSSNLATPQITHDSYLIKGQGIGGNFRPYRTEIGRVFDPFTKTGTTGGYIVIKTGGGAFFEAGGSGGVTFGVNKQGVWDDNNENNNLVFLNEGDLWESGSAATYKIDERIYYKSHGEKTTTSLNELDYIGGENAVTGEVDGNGFFGNFKVKAIPGITNERIQDERVARNNLIHKVTNEEINTFHVDNSDLIRDYGGNDVENHFLHEYEIFYYDWGTSPYAFEPEHYLKRDLHPKHNAGYKVLDQSGSYYVYGLPTYNTSKTEEVFSVNGANNWDNCDPSISIPNDGVDVDYEISNTHKYHSKTQTPGYATSYLLTSILGADYIDVDNNGPSENDKGYWVKMDYVRYAGGENPYKWRAPFSDALYMKGSVSTLEDDRASYQYGEKEMWYMNRMETKTHIVIFELSERKDNFEVSSQFNTGNSLGEKSGLKIDKIHLYEKRDFEANGEMATPIQTVHFVYDYSLCKNILNNNGLAQSDEHVISNEKGKLTLKELYITSQGNERGKLTPYKFNYDDPDISNSLENPDYSLNKYDRWGSYKNELDECNQINMPYTKQFNYSNFQDQTEKQNFEDESSAVAGAWTLKEISLPSGGKINIDFESDDYAYVQSERATQMFNIVNVNDNTTHDVETTISADGGPLSSYQITTETVGSNLLYNENNVAFNENTFDIDPHQRRVYFRLENLIPYSANTTDLQYGQQVFDLYVRDIIKDEGGERNLFFKNYMQLKDQAWDYVSGYIPLENDLSGDYPTSSNNATIIEKFHYGVAGLVGNSYTQGYITLQCAKKKNGDCFERYHPMSIVAWQYVRTNHPELLGDPGDDFSESNLIGTAAMTSKLKAKKVKNLLGFIPEISQMFQGYRNWCYNKEMGQVIDHKRSVIKLTTPDKKKKGGGVRVKRITLNDNWNSFEGDENSEEYGMESLLSESLIF